MKQQDLVSMVVTKEVQATVLGLIEQIRQQIPGRVSLSVDQRRSLQLMGPRSENYGRLCLVTIAQNLDLLPRGIDIDEAFADLEARDNLIPILKALQQLVEEIDDTIAALGSDVMVVANTSYGVMKAAGGNAALDEAVRELSMRHRKTRKKSEKPEGESS
ncbi:hypothetical protein LF41_1790 [Lysobacter dokdonensis DS-58]|uniref:Uncharacterized protein n=1 Tax=Lysobacter dokdonensis DS-58 TaxID=1300345 RepID=A0A0A2WCU6_9GAMM|nr:hypothetical protein [Lysobacter dokdonensis]KGQ17936.1 hypothetical protein LF41_1790 [Lysobacter dokdonensis DS-58]